MKSLRSVFLLMVCACVLGTTFTSCLSDDDDDTNVTKALTKEEIAAQRSAMRGAYEGYIHFINDTTMKEDSILTNWTIADSTLRVVVPVKLFCNGVNDKTARNLMLTSEESVEVSGYVYPYNSMYNDNKDTYLFTFFPENGKKEFTINKDDAPHKVTVTFATQLNIYNMGTFSSIGQYYKGKMISYILLYSIVVDGVTYYCNSPMYFIGDKIA